MGDSSGQSPVSVEYLVLYVSQVHNWWEEL